MAIVFPDQGRILALDILLRVTDAAKIRLFKNDFTPDQATQLGDLEQADFSGYAEQDPGFAGATINGSGQGEVSKLDVTFTHDATVDAGNTIYGWYIVREVIGGGKKLLFVERFTDSILVEADGDRVRFDLRLFDQIAS